MLTPLPKGVQTKYLKLFWLQIFSITHRCQRHRWCTLSCLISKKIEAAIMGYWGACGKLIHGKILSLKSRGTVPLGSSNIWFNKKMFAFPQVAPQWLPLVLFGGSATLGKICCRFHFYVWVNNEWLRIYQTFMSVFHIFLMINEKICVSLAQLCMHARRFYSQSKRAFFVFSLLKGPSGKIRLAWKWYNWIGLISTWCGMCFKIFNIARNQEI